jgi:hypothetical protein
MKHESEFVFTRIGIENERPTPHNTTGAEEGRALRATEIDTRVLQTIEQIHPLSI